MALKEERKWKKEERVQKDYFLRWMSDRKGCVKLGVC
jgi:hypothetical protein